MENNGNVLIREFLDYVWRLRVWIIIAVAASLFAAFCYLQTRTPVYERTTWIKLNGNGYRNFERFKLRILYSLNENSSIKI